MKVLYALESIRTPWLDTVMAAITHLGEETVFMVAALFVFWCVSKRHGYYLLAIGFAGTVLNQFLKLLFRIPRPWVLDSDFTIVESARAQATDTPSPAAIARTPSVPSAASPGSPAEMGAGGGDRGCGAGAAVPHVSGRSHAAGCGRGRRDRRGAGVRPVSPDGAQRQRHGVMGAVLAVMLALAAGYLLFVSLYPFPADVDAANLASGVENAWKLLGATVGMLVGWWLDVRFIHFDTRAVWYVQLIKLVGGLALLLGIRAALKAPLAAALGARSRRRRCATA